MIKELMKQISKLGRATEYDTNVWKTAGASGFNEAIGDILIILEPYKIYDELIEKVSSWWDDVYPEDIFTGVSGDEGAVKVAEIRELLDKIVQN